MKGVAHTRVVSHYRITNITDWRRIRACDVLAVHGIGKGYLNKLRLWLAQRDVCLKDDNSPSYWLQLQGLPAKEYPGLCPFTVVIDTNETLPFSFSAIKDRDGKIIQIPTIIKPMWVQGLGDYSIEGMESDVQIERKSMDDLLGTLSGRRENFEAEIAQLDSLCSFSAIVCECSWADILQDNHEHGARAKGVSRTFLSWAIKYPSVHWIMCAGRGHAEIVTYWLLHNFWWQSQRDESASELRQTAKQLFAPVGVGASK